LVKSVRTRGGEKGVNRRKTYKTFGMELPNIQESAGGPGGNGNLLDWVSRLWITAKSVAESKRTAIDWG